MRTERKIQLAALASRVVRRAMSLSGRPNISMYRRGGIQWELDLRQGIDFAIFLQGGFEPSTLREYGRLVKEGDTVFDIGANIGAHTLPLAEFVGPHGVVAAFEPTDYAFNKLQRNLALNPTLAQRVTAVQALLVGAAELQKPEAIPSSWSLVPPGLSENIHPVHKGTYNSLSGATAIQLDQWVEEKNIDRLDFVKIDVDGFEIDVLEGARQTLKRFRPPIMMEFAPYVFRERGRTFNELVTLLRQEGYQAREVHGRVLELSPSLEQAIPHGGSINVILNAA
jgi:FkbM family methyltransferase